MSTGRDGDWADRDDTAEGEAARGPAGSRRLLLAGATGGFALAASGLLLPADLVEEAAADNHPVRRVQDRKERRREKERRKRRRRTDGDHTSKGKHSPDAFIRGVSLRVEGDPQFGFNAKFYVYDFPTFVLAETRALSGGGDVFQTKSIVGILWINDRYFIRCNNPPTPFQDGELGYGGSIDQGGWHGGTHVDAGLVGGLFALYMNVDGLAFTLTGEPKDNDYLKFVLRIQRQSG